MVTTDNTVESFKDLVSRHQVCWDVWPEYGIDAAGNRIQTGFELSLAGIHYRPEHPPAPGCSECEKVYAVLKRIAEWILPKEERESRYEVRIEPSFSYSPKRKFREEVLLGIKIRHREGFSRPTDACEVKCLNEMQAKLAEIGAPQGRWMP
jgi:hypothetical protein